MDCPWFSPPGPRNGGFSPSPARREGCTRTQVAAASSWCHVTACDLKEKSDFPTPIFSSPAQPQIQCQRMPEETSGLVQQPHLQLLFPPKIHDSVCIYLKILSEPSSHHTRKGVATLSGHYFCSAENCTGFAYDCHLRVTVQTFKKIKNKRDSLGQRLNEHFFPTQMGSRVFRGVGRKAKS